MSDENTPGISVVIPCFNMGRFLAEAVASVLAQGHPKLEIIVVDDGSSDDTRERAQRLATEVVYLHQENGGPAAARNRGLDAARHDLIAFLDADDLWHPDKTRTQLAHLEREPQLDLVLGNQRGFALRAGAAEGSADYELDESASFIFLVGCGLFRRRVFDEIGRFDESMRFSEDTDWFFRCRELGARYEILPDVALFYRRHGGSMTHGRDAIGKGFLVAIKKSLDRRRGTGQRERALPQGDAHGARSRDVGGAPAASAVERGPEPPSES